MKSFRAFISGNPHSDESFLGFVLRMAGQNGVGGLKWVLEQLGRRSVSQLSDADELKIAYLFGADLRSVEAAVVRGRWVDGVHVQWVRGQEVTRPYLLRTPRPQWCPRCLDENGFARMLWEFQLVTACPIHRIKLMERCHCCSRLLRWQRRALASCSCGASLRNTSCEVAHEVEVEVASWIRAQVDCTTPCQALKVLPTSLLSRMSLDGGMRLLYAAGLRRDAGHRVGPGEAKAGLTTVECRDLVERATERLNRISCDPSVEDQVHLQQLVHIPALMALAQDGVTAADRQLARSMLEVGLRVHMPLGRLSAHRQNAQLTLPGV